MFKNRKNTEIKCFNYYDLNSEKDGKFDVVLFSFSFMLMPEKEKALSLAK